MIKSFKEMMGVDVSPFCDYRKGKDDKGKEIEIPYLPWAKCLELLYDNGAEKVRFNPRRNEDGTLVFSATGFESTSDKGIVTAGYFVIVDMEIDGESYSISYPVMNGTAVVNKNTMNQLRISNSIQRAFVKCVAVNTGLGFSLWLGDGDETSEKSNPMEDPFAHNPLAVKEAIERIMTAKINGGKSTDEIFGLLNINERQYKSIITGLTNAAWLIGALSKL